MKRPLHLAVLLTAVTALGGTAASAQSVAPFVVVERVGDGSAALTSAGTAVFLDEYSLTGTLLSSYALPTTGTPLVDSGSASSDGQLTTSGNGNFLLIPGYDAAVGTAGIASSTSAAVPREVATLSSTGALVQTTFNNFTGNNIRSVASQDGTTLFAAGGNVGIVALTSGTSGSTNTGTVVSSTSTNNRVVQVFNNQLYLSTGSGTTLRLATVGTAPGSAAAGQTATAVPGIPIGTTTTTPVNSPYGFVVANLAATGDTIYVADNGTGTIEKFSLASGAFTLTGTVPLANVYGLIGRTVAGTEQLFATTPAGLFSLTDLSGAGGTLTAIPTAIASAGTNEAFRGVTTFNFVIPNNAVPEPSTYALLAVGGFGALALLRRRAC